VSAPPVFVVVGHVNRGKSSLVSTLAADESVVIAAGPGTTRDCRAFPMRVDGEHLYTLVDTPGFERARHALAWLREHETSTGERPATVREFVRVQAIEGAFAQERELLEPILAGGSILYVVDGSLPFNPVCEAETEILRWTGRPRMALINTIGSADHIDDWRRVLDQYFGLVRVFDTHEADFERRIHLLRAMRELDEEARAALDRAIGVLAEDRRQGLQQSAAAIADALVDMLTRVESERLPRAADPEPHKAGLAARYYDRLRERELALRRDLREIYLHRNLVVELETVEATDQDLFDLSTWSRLGLSRPQLAAGGAATGAVLGGTIDATLGGASFLLGTVIGAATGLASTWFAWDRLAEVKLLGQPLGGTLLQIGPMRSPNFPWVVLGRALHLHVTVSNRSHAKRDAVQLGGSEGIVAGLPSALRRQLQGALDRISRTKDAAKIESARLALTAALRVILEQLEASPDAE
jgi:hypothetical protein